MAYDLDMADRVRTVLSELGLLGQVTERNLWGGLSFMVNGNIALSVYDEGNLVARVDPEQTDDLVDGTIVLPHIVAGRESSGWVKPTPKAVHTDADLKTWLRRSVGYAQALPPK